MFNDHLSKLPNNLKIEIYEKTFGEYVNINEQSQADVYFYSSLFSSANVINDLFDMYPEKCYFRVMICLICRDKLDIGSCNYYDMFIESCLTSTKCVDILKLMTLLMRNIYYCYYTGDNYKFYDNTSVNNYKGNETCDDYADYENCIVVFRTDTQSHFYSILKKTSKIFYSKSRLNEEILKLIYNHNMFESPYIPISNTLFEHQSYTDKITYVIHHKLWKICEMYVSGKLSCITKYIPKTYILNLILNCDTDLDLSVFLNKYSSDVDICDALCRVYFPSHPNIFFSFNDVELEHVDYIYEKYLNVAQKKVASINMSTILNVKNNHNVTLMFLTNSNMWSQDELYFMCLIYINMHTNLESNLWTRLSPEIYKKLVHFGLHFNDAVMIHFFANHDIDIPEKVLLQIIATKLDKRYINACIHRLMKPTKIINYIDCINMLLDRNPKEIDYVKNILRSNDKSYTIELLKTISAKIPCVHDVIIDIICKKCEQQNQPNEKFICCICLTNMVDYSSKCGHSVCAGCFSQNPQSKCPICNDRNYKRNAHKLY
jgi:hypothetical protein